MRKWSRISIIIYTAVVFDALYVNSLLNLYVNSFIKVNLSELTKCQRQCKTCKYAVSDTSDCPLLKTLTVSGNLEWNGVATDLFFSSS